LKSFLREFEICKVFRALCLWSDREAMGMVLVFFSSFWKMEESPVSANAYSHIFVTRALLQCWGGTMVPLAVIFSSPVM
jgi:hypothetical protein